MTAVTRYDRPVFWYAELFPPLPFAEYEKLKADMRAHGQIHPIVISREGLLLDGRNRMSICRELDLTPYTIFLDDVHNAKGMSEVEFIDSVNLLRRHLTDDQRIALAAAKAAGLIEQAKEQKKRKPESVSVKSPTQKIDVRKDLAKAAKVSEVKAGAALKLAKENPEALKEVAKGTTTLKQASGGGKKRKTAKLPEKKPVITAVQPILDSKGQVYEVMPSVKDTEIHVAMKWLRGFLNQFDHLEIAKTNFHEVLEGFGSVDQSLLMATLNSMQHWISGWPPMANVTPAAGTAQHNVIIDKTPVREVRVVIDKTPHQPVQEFNVVIDRSEQP
jgi:hypothetical protein